MTWITGAGATAYGRWPGLGTLDLMTAATDVALRDAELTRPDIDGLLCGYSTTMPHLMLANVFAEHDGLAPGYAHAVQAGGATGLAMLMLACQLVAGGVCRNVLVVAAENRLTGQSRQSRPHQCVRCGVRGCGQAHTHQHVTAAIDWSGARQALDRATDASGMRIGDVKYAGVYDSFTITLLQGDGGVLSSHVSAFLEKTA